MQLSGWGGAGQRAAPQARAASRTWTMQTRATWGTRQAASSEEGPALVTCAALIPLTQAAPLTALPLLPFTHVLP